MRINPHRSTGERGGSGDRHGELWIATSCDPFEMPPDSRSSAVSGLRRSRLLFDRCSDPFGGELSFPSSIVLRP
ncbi:hypothetical protein BHE74_00026002 [Ensete ventricosum]|nr:hypothetical protein GW17_00052402 [Ensete ventricosum]RWW66616.1 hypothetical protein BHE74_00026002 [Ensete ventricosum]RZR99775.1 hypothetical protein BHM03_00029384 [Ensete ventricosum]